MSVIKQKQESNFTQVSNKALNDKSLSMKAKGLYSYLYSKPIGWDFSGERIVLDCSDGRKAVYSGLQELEQKGYITRNKEPDGRTTYSLFIEPIAQNGQEGTEPIAHFGKQPKRQTAQTGSISNTDIIVIKNISNTSEEASQDKDYLKINEGIEALKELNEVGYKRWFGNKTQRSAIKELVQVYTPKQLQGMAQYVRANNGQKYFPSVSTPTQLLEKIPNIKAWADKEKSAQPTIY